jgi:hypothetical protein
VHSFSVLGGREYLALHRETVTTLVDLGHCDSAAAIRLVLRLIAPFTYTPQITSSSPQEMRVLRRCKVPRAEVMFVTIQRENIHPQRKKWTRLLQCLNCPMFAVRLWITTSPYRWSVGSLPSTCMLCTPPPHCTKDVYTPRRDQLVICGQYDSVLTKILFVCLLVVYF